MLRYLAGLVVCAAVAVAQSSWTITQDAIPGAITAYTIAFGNGRFVVTTNSGKGAYWTTDGITWTGVPMNFAGAVVFVRGSFYIAGSAQLLRSADGTAWQVMDTAPRPDCMFSSMASDGTTLLAGSRHMGDRTLYFSADRRHLVETAPLPDTEPANGIVSLGNVAYAAGRYYVSYLIEKPDSSYRAAFASTIDGTTWRPEPAITSWVANLAGGNGRILGAADNAHQGSLVVTDGENVTFPVVDYFILTRPTYSFAGGRFWSAYTLSCSSDGTKWRSLATAALPPYANIHDVAYGNGRYIAVGDNDNKVMIATVVAAPPPLIAKQPLTQTHVEGTDVTLAVGIDNVDASTTYQWYRGGFLLPGATTATYALSAAAPADSGTYRAVIANAQGAVTTEPAVLTIVPIGQAGRITNASVSATTDATVRDFTVGFATGGGGATGLAPFFVRAVGPSLARFGVPNPNPDPYLEAYAGSNLVNANDDGGGCSFVFAPSAGAFPIGLDTKDAAVGLTAIPAGLNSIKVRGVGENYGTILAEVYSIPSMPIVMRPRLMNVSVLKRINGDETVTLGFFLGGETDRTVLIRAVGPSLSAFGIPGPLANPTLAVYKLGATVPLRTNDNWGGDEDLSAAFRAVGAFDMPATSKDSAVLMTLSPGGYTAQVTSATGDAGSTLVEVYEIP